MPKFEQQSTTFRKGPLEAHTQSGLGKTQETHTRKEALDPTAEHDGDDDDDGHHHHHHV